MGFAANKNCKAGFDVGKGFSASLQLPLVCQVGGRGNSGWEEMEVLATDEGREIWTFAAERELGQGRSVWSTWQPRPDRHQEHGCWWPASTFLTPRPLL